MRGLSRSVVLATTTALAGTAQAQESGLFADVGVELGFGFEYEKKSNDNYGFSDEVDWTRSAPLAKISLAFPSFNGKLFYTIKSVNKEGDNNRYESDGFRHELIFGGNFSLGNGFTGGLFYDASLETASRDQGASTDLEERTVEQTFRPTLSYASSDGSWGFYSQLELLRAATDNEVNWTSDMYHLDKEGYAVLIEPYYKMGNVKVGVEFYHQEADNTTVVGATTTQLDTYTESYVQPSISYSIPDAGVLSLRARFGEKETMVTGGAWGTPGTYYVSDVRKLTLGYEQNVGNWRLNASVERSWETETSNNVFLTGREKNTTVDSVEFTATLKF